MDRVSQFTTPIIIARKKKQKVEFYSEADFEKWFNSQARLRNFADLTYRRVVVRLGTSVDFSFRFFSKPSEPTELQSQELIENC